MMTVDEFLDVVCDEKAVERVVPGFSIDQRTAATDVHTPQLV